MTCARCASEIQTGSRFCASCGTRVSQPHEAARLARLPEEGKLGGVCAGLGAYLDVDVSLVRLAWVVLSVVPGVVLGGVLAYIAAWVLMPVATPAERSAAALGGRRFTRSAEDSMIGGVLGGMAAYFAVDATLVRDIAVVLAIYPGAVIGGVLVYLAAWFILPLQAPPAAAPPLSDQPTSNPA